MKQIAVISGKGGTGKTSLVASFAALAGEKAVLVDSDVDAANLSLVTGSEIFEEHEFRASKVAVIDQQKCNECDLCRELCRFDAIESSYEVDPISCEGCGFCSYICPVRAIAMMEKRSGSWFVSKTACGLLVHARLGIAEENSGKLVSKIRERGRELAESEKLEYVIIDGPPGIGCPVIASLSGVDQALIVTEPTVSGVHDLKRVFDVCRHFDIPASVCINRYDLSEIQSNIIEEYCFGQGIPLAGKIPLDRAFVDAQVAGMPVVRFAGGQLLERISLIWDQVK